MELDDRLEQAHVFPLKNIIKKNRCYFGNSIYRRFMDNGIYFNAKFHFSNIYETEYLSIVMKSLIDFMSS